MNGTKSTPLNRAKKPSKRSFVFLESGPVVGEQCMLMIVSNCIHDVQKH